MCECVVEGKLLPLFLDFSKDPRFDQSTSKDTQENNKTEPSSLIPRPPFHWSGNETTTHHILQAQSLQIYC